MRKLALFLVVFISGYTWCYSQTITVDRPTTGDVWEKGKTYNIRWTKTGTMPALVQIWLRNTASTKTLLVISDRTDNDGIHPWKIPTGVAVGNYRIRVVTGGGTIWGDSKVFAIKAWQTPHPVSDRAFPELKKITVTVPKKGDNWHSEKTYWIQWQTCLKGPFKLELSYEPRKDRKEADIGIRQGNIVPPGCKYSYQWTIPKGIVFDPQNWDYYYIRVSTLDDQFEGFSETFYIYD
jgi:hypothetical protein